jgi:hypothetical protein
MSSIPAAVLSDLNVVAFEILEVFEERGYRVDVAVQQDAAFEASGRSRSSLSRDLIAEAFTTGASRRGFDLDSYNGGAKQFRIDLGHSIGVFRLKKADKTLEGFRVLTNSASTWADIDEDTLMAEAPYVFAYTFESSRISEIFVAPVLDVIEGKPGRLVLGEAIILNSSSPAPGGSFAPDVSDALPGFGDDSASSDVVEGTERWSA